MDNSKRFGLLIAGLIVAGAAGAVHYQHAELLRVETQIAQSAISSVAPALEIDHFSLPVSAAIFITSPGEHRGYFTLKRRDGSPIAQNCAAMTFDFTTRAVSGGEVALEVDADDAAHLQHCA